MSGVATRQEHTGRAEPRFTLQTDAFSGSCPRVMAVGKESIESFSVVENRGSGFLEHISAGDSPLGDAVWEEGLSTGHHNAMNIL